MKHLFTKRAFGVFLSLILLLGAFAVLPASVKAEAALDLRVSPFGSETTEIKAWYNASAKSYDLF